MGRAVRLLLAEHLDDSDIFKASVAILRPVPPFTIAVMNEKVLPNRRPASGISGSTTP
jgi:hypothetical protein